MKASFIAAPLKGGRYHGAFWGVLLCVLWSSTASARLHSVFEHEWIAETPWGWVGIGDAVRGVSDDGKDQFESEVYLGPWEFYISGSASFWIWTASTTSTSIPIVLAALWLFLKRARPWLSGLFWAMGGLTFGFMVVFLGVFDFGGNSYYKVWPQIAGSPFGFIDLRLGCFFWLTMGILLKASERRWAWYMLLVCLGLHYLAIVLFAALPFHLLNTQELRDLPNILTSFPKCFAAWVLIYLAGQIFVWSVVVKRLRARRSEELNPTSQADKI